MFDIEHTRPIEVAILRVHMNKAETDRVHELCSLIEKEQNRNRFLELVKELNGILDAKEERLSKESLSEGETS